MQPRFDNARVQPIQQHKQPAQQTQTQQSNSSQGNYKTRLCRHFEIGKCRLAGLCNFAHGEEELNFYLAQARVSRPNQSHRDRSQQPARSEPTGSESKIDQLEKSMEDFEFQQKSIIWNLKHFLQGVGDSPDPRQIQAINQYFFEIYNNSTGYLEKVGNLTGLQKEKQEPPSQKPSLAQNNDFESNSQARLSKDYGPTVRPKEETRTPLSYEAKLKSRLKYVLNSLIDLYPSRSDYFKHFNDARKNIQENKLEEAARAIEKIFMDDNLEDSLKMRHNDIAVKARKLESN